MGQRASRDVNHGVLLAVWAFRTELGWFGIVGCGDVVESLTFGHSTQGEVLARLSPFLSGGAAVRDWNPRLRKRLERYAEQGGDDFADLTTRETEFTPFASQVIAAVRRIPAGETRSYAEVASDAGSPRAARAVGNIMARNPIPIIIPCHRVTASGGLIGGYSAPRGLDMKRLLLRLEQPADSSRSPRRTPASQRRLSATPVSRS
jgi:methylated-DNA-[protein]-cysteine S-methyltransferase